MLLAFDSNLLLLLLLIRWIHPGAGRVGFTWLDLGAGTGSDRIGPYLWGNYKRNGTVGIFQVFWGDNTPESVLVASGG